MNSKHSCSAFLMSMLLSLSTAGGQTLPDALDSPGIVWTTTAAEGNGTPVPGGEWAGQTATTQDGVDAARSGVLPLSATSKLRTESFTGPGTLTFWRRHGRLPEENSFAIFVNNNYVGPFLPGGVWQPVAIDVPPGPVVLEFQWSNSGSTLPQPDNHAYVDSVDFAATSGAPGTIPAAIPSLTIGEGYTIVPPIALTGEKPMQLQLTVPGNPSPYIATLDPVTAGGNPAFGGFPYSFIATPSVAGTWSLSATNNAGSLNRSFTVTVVPAAPHSLYFRGPYTAWAGANFELTAEAGGTAPFTWQWFRNNTLLPGETSQTLDITGFSAADAGDYHFVATNGLGSRASSPQSISMGTDPPVMTTQPLDIDQPLLGFDYLSVTFEGTTPFATEWRKDGLVVASEPESLAGGSYLELDGDPATVPGVYAFTVQNGLGIAAATPVVVQVGRGPEIANAMDNATVGWRHEEPAVPAWERQTVETHDGTDAVTVSGQPAPPLRTAVSGPAMVSFWWCVEDGDLDFSVDGSVARTISAPAATQSAWEKVQWSIGTGWHQLSWQTRDPGHARTAAWLDEFVIAGGVGGPVIAAHPQGGSFTSGDTVNLTVTVTGLGPFDYRLYHRGVLVQSILADPANTYTFPVSLTPASAGAWWIEVTDAAGRMAASDDALIFVDGDYGSLQELAVAVGQPDNEWGLSSYSYLDNSFHGPGLWYRTRQAGFNAPPMLCARTSELQTGDFAGVTMIHDSSDPGPWRLSFAARSTGDALSNVMGVSVDGTLESPTVAGTTAGADGETWTRYHLSLPGSYHEIQWEALALTNGVGMFLDDLVIVPAVPPQISQQPVHLVLPAGETGSLTVAAASVTPVTYQWNRVGSGPLPGQMSATLHFPSLSPADAGSYYAEVSNEFGTATSSTVTVTVTGARPVITQPLPRRWLQPGEALQLTVAATGGTGPLTYRWYFGQQLVQTGGTAFSRASVALSHDGIYRVEVADAYYIISSETRVTVSSVLYQLTWLPALEGGGNSSARSINRAGVVAGSGGNSAMVWTGGVPRRLTPAGSPPTDGQYINDAGEVVGIRYGDATPLNARSLVRWLPPYGPGDVIVMDPPPGHPYVEAVTGNNRGDIVVSDFVYDPLYTFRSAHRRTAAGWEPLGPLAGMMQTGLDDSGGHSALFMNNAGVTVGQSVFRGAGGQEQTTGWIFQPQNYPRMRTAIDSVDTSLALTPAQPWGWLDAVNDRGDIVARRWPEGGPTTLYVKAAGGPAVTVLSMPGGQGFGGSFNVDTINNRREMGGLLIAGGLPRAALFRKEGAPPGFTPPDFSAYGIRDLNDLVSGGTGTAALFRVNGMNDSGQIVGDAEDPPGSVNFRGFLLTPVVSYPPMAMLSVDDVLERNAGQAVNFTTASLVMNDRGTGPFTVTQVNTGSPAAGTLTNLGAGTWRYTPPAGPDMPDAFRYTVQAQDGSTSVATVHVRVAPAPLPPPDGSPMQILPGGFVRVFFSGLAPNTVVRLIADDDLSGPGSTIAVLLTAPDGSVLYLDNPPPGANRRFYRVTE